MVGMSPNVSPFERIEGGGMIEHLDGGNENIYINESNQIKGNPQSHFDNLANYLMNVQLKGLASNINRAIEIDIDSRKDWIAKLVKSLDLLGIKNENVSTPFPGASNGVSPAFMQAWLTLSAQVRAELFRTEGCADTKILGLENEFLVASAQRMKDELNYLLMEEMDYYSQREKTLAWSLLYGSMFTKVFYDDSNGIPSAPFIKPENLIVAYSVSTLSEAQRITEVQYISENEYKNRVRSGMYKDVKLREYDEGSDGEDNQELNQKVSEIEGINIEEGEGQDKIYKMMECHCYLDIPEFRPIDDNGQEIPMPLPYIITFESQSFEVVGLYRNWKENDFSFKPIKHFVHWSPLPGLGFYGFGLVHIVGNLAESSTKSRRMLMDAGILSNFPAFIRARGIQSRESTIKIQPMAVTEVDIGNLASLDAAIKQLPFKGPDPTLKLMKDEDEKALLDLVGAANQPFGEGGIGSNQPVGTTLAVIEQSQRTQSSIMRRFHQSLAEELKMISEIVAIHMSDQCYPFDVSLKGIDEKTLQQNNGQMPQVPLGTDFKLDLIKVIPVADPNVNSSTQRLIRAESLYNFSTQLSQAGIQVNLREVASRLFNELKIDNVDSILPPEDDVKSLNPMSENMNMMVGKPVKASLWQDHPAHMISHQQFLMAHQDDPDKVANAKAHISEHEAMQYMIDMQQQMGIQLPENLDDLDEQQQNELAQKVAEVSKQMMEQQQSQQQQQPQPIDPNVVYMEDLRVKDKGLDVKVALDSQRLQLNEMKIEYDYKIQSQKIALDREKAESELKLKDEIEALKAQISMMKINNDQTKEMIDVDENPFN